MHSTPNRNTQDGAAVYSPLVLKIYDAWVLGVSNHYAWQCPTRSVLLPFFQQHLSANHLDIGVGTGYYLANSRLHQGQKLALLDVNRNSLASASARVAPPVQPQLIQEDILQPRGALGQRQFDSISLFYLLHCLPDSMAQKADVVFDLARQHLTADGTLYGATIMGDSAKHNWLGRRLMAVYNRKGIFGNQGDTMADLESTLNRHFGKVSLHQQGKVALFCAQSPL